MNNETNLNVTETATITTDMNCNIDETATITTDMNTTFEPNFAVPPGETLAETLETLSMTQAGLAERMGRPLKTINEIVAGKAAITSDTALQLEKVLGVPASFWTNHERIYRDTLARRRETATESYIVSPVTTYEEKMDFLSQIRKECGLDKVDVDIHDDSSHAGKYITEYTFGTI